LGSASEHARDENTARRHEVVIQVLNDKLLLAMARRVSKRVLLSVLACLSQAHHQCPCPTQTVVLAAPLDPAPQCHAHLLHPSPPATHPTQRAPRPLQPHVLLHLPNPLAQATMKVIFSTAVVALALGPVVTDAFLLHTAPLRSRAAVVMTMRAEKVRCPPFSFSIPPATIRP